MTLVSGMEQQTAEQAGFESQQMLLNGSGKVAWEVEAAVRSNVLLNVDSEFDLHLIIGNNSYILHCKTDGLTNEGHLAVRDLEVMALCTIRTHQTEKG